MIDNYKIIFLDIDGVLNSTSWVHNELKKKPWKKCIVGYDILDIRIRDRLRLFLIEHPNVRLVISSSWRLWSLKSTIDEFKKSRICTLVPFIVGVTPRSIFGRGRQIEWFVKRHHIKDYVIIDDENDINDDEHFVQTDYTVGLQEKDYTKIKKILRI